MRRPSARHVLIGGALAALIVLLLIEGFTTKTVGAASTHAAGASADAGLGRSQPILSYQSGRLASTERPPGKRISLTFDDGPSGHWTPKIAAILRARHVPATFFEVGSAVVRHPEITRALHRDGFVIGNHTFTHADLASLPGWERSAQIALTQTAISGAIGLRPRLMRPPYSSSPGAVTRQQARAWAPIAHDGYEIVLSNYDTEDWNHPDVATIVRNGIPRGSQGGIVLLHDAGGSRRETVAALPLLIDALRRRGFEFVPLTTLMHAPASAAASPAPTELRTRGWLFIQVLGFAGWLTSTLTLLVAGVTALVGLRMAAGLALAKIQRRRAGREPPDPAFTPPVSILVPAYDEAVVIARSIGSLAASRYAGELEVIVVDDGSKDGTGDIVEALGLDRVRLIRQPNAGKAAALNRALAASRHEIVVTVDGDTVFEPETLAALVQRFQDPAVGSVSGNTKIGNRRSLIGRWQHIEYVMGFNLDRRAYEVIGATPTVPGAIGAFRRAALQDIGGISGATIAEDTDITLDIARAGWRVVYEERARAWTEAPSGLRALCRQRSRWAYGTIQSAWKHRGALWGRGGHAFGRRAVGVLLVFQIALPLTAPLIDLFAIYSLVFLDPMPILGFWLAFNVFQLALAWVAFGLDGESRRVLFALPLQQFVWRQVMYFVVLDGIVCALLGRQLGWRHLERTGELAPSSEAA